jgi:NitT/TauT family transport system substrate-binding protein
MTMMPTFSALGATKIDFGVASIDPSYGPVYVALKKGFFDHDSVSVNYMNTQSGPRSKQLLAAGQLFATVTGTNDAIALSIAGKPATLVYSFDKRVSFANMLVNNKAYDSGITSVEKLSGGTVACTQPQAATWLMATHITEGAGLKGKVTITGLGDFTTMMGAVKSGRVDACMATVAMIDKAVQEGWGRALFDITDDDKWNSVFGGDLPGLSSYVLAKTAKKNPEAVQALVTGLVKATRWCEKASAEEISDLIYADYLSHFPEMSVVRGLEVFKKIWNYSSLITEDNYNRLVGIMTDRQYPADEMKKAPYSALVDMSFVKKAQQG